MRLSEQSSRKKGEISKSLVWKYSSPITNSLSGKWQVVLSVCIRNHILLQFIPLWELSSLPRLSLCFQMLSQLFEVLLPPFLPVRLLQVFSQQGSVSMLNDAKLPSLNRLSAFFCQQCPETSKANVCHYRFLLCSVKTLCLD